MFTRNQIQYDQFTEGLIPAAEVVEASSWAQPQNQPIPNNFVKRAAGYAIALIATGIMFWSTYTPLTAAESFDWLPQQNQPYPYKHVLTEAIDSSDGQAVLGDDSSNYFRQPIYPDKVLGKTYLHASQQIATFYDPSFAAETVFVSSFVQPQSQPYPARKNLTEACDSSDGESPIGLVPASAAPSASGVSAEIIRLKIQRKYASQIQSFFWGEFTPSTTPTESFDWLPQQNQPVQTKKNLHVSEQQYLFFRPTTSSTVTWYPTYPANFTRLALHASQQQAYFAPLSEQPETVETAAWIQPQSQPYPSRLNLSTANQQFSVEPLSEQAETVETAGWLQPQQDQTKGRTYLLAANQQAFFWQPLTPATVIFENWSPVYPDRINSKPALLTAEQQASFWGNSTPEANWLPIYPDTATRKQNLSASQQQAYFAPLSEQQETVFVSSFVQPQSQPYPARKNLLTAEQIAAFWNTSTQPENVLVSSWVQPQSQPYPYRQNLAVDQQQFLTEPLSEQQEVVESSSWYPTYPQPFPTKLYLLAANQQFLTEPLSEQPEIVESSSWYPVYPQPFPARLNLQTAQQQAQTEPLSEQPENVFVSSWIQPQVQPFPVKKYLTEAIDSSDGQSPIGLVPASAAPSASGVSAEVIRLKIQRKYASQIQSFFWSTYTPPAVTIFTNWLPVYPDRIPGKTYLLTANQQAYFAPLSEQQETVFVSSYVQPQSQPYPSRLNLTAAQQQASTEPLSEQPETVETAGWLQPQSQPFPARKNLATALQQFSVEPLSEQQEVVESASWYPIYPQPFPTRLYLLTVNQQYQTEPLSEQAENVLVSSWIQP